MPGINQLPAGAEGAAAFSMVYSIISLICSGLMLWLNMVHKEGPSYIALTAAVTGVSTIASLAQQVHDVTLYEDIVREAFRRKPGYVDNPELIIANGSFGADLVLYYIQYWLYVVEALLVAFWAGELAQSVYGLNRKPRLRAILQKVNAVGKIVAFLLPLTTVLLLQVPALKKSLVGFLLVADLPLMIGLAMGSSLVIAILVRYSKSKRKFTNWTPPGNSSQSSGVISTTTDGPTMRSRKPAPRASMLDRWLLVRFTCAFAVLAVFEVTNTLFQLQGYNNIRKDVEAREPDLSADRAKTTFFLFLPGTTAGIFLFIIFGTTTGCRTKMYETFVPKSWRDRPSTRSSRGGAEGQWRWPGPNRLASMEPPEPRHESIMLRDDVSKGEMAIGSAHPSSGIVAHTTITIRHDDDAKPLPPRPLAPAFSFHAHDSAGVRTGIGSMDRSDDFAGFYKDGGRAARPGRPVVGHSVQSLSDVLEEHYYASTRSPLPVEAEHSGSDDSEPMLPIMLSPQLRVATAPGAT